METNLQWPTRAGLGFASWSEGKGLLLQQTVQPLILCICKLEIQSQLVSQESEESEFVRVDVSLLAFRRDA